MKSPVTRTGIPFALRLNAFVLTPKKWPITQGVVPENAGPLVWPGRRAGSRERDRKSIKGLSYQRPREIHGAI